MARWFGWLADAVADWWNSPQPPKRTSALKAKSSWKKRRVEEYRREKARIEELRRGK